MFGLADSVGRSSEHQRPSRRATRLSVKIEPSIGANIPGEVRRLPIAAVRLGARTSSFTFHQLASVTILSMKSGTAVRALRPLQNVALQP
jgi:hypothetical protein